MELNINNIDVFSYLNTIFYYFAPFMVTILAIAVTPRLIFVIRKTIK
ncbi:hypothetical protein SAMN02745123_03601 [Desulforamulus aeronauticus DSM 10349]|uniref:Uncharacterized protein n=1 Tax=Desulforamulus aeronauticus DSM 10349 TaxID=1121421 RepID=A0A1M6WF24_9FIRM|nr:hypothetical protein SAMN02745123_03601 [Desulforamulus aeronauticus DSM 10349]